TGCREFGGARRGAARLSRRSPRVGRAGVVAHRRQRPHRSAAGTSRVAESAARLHLRRATRGLRDAGAAAPASRSDLLTYGQANARSCRYGWLPSPDTSRLDVPLAGVATSWTTIGTLTPLPAAVLQLSVNEKVGKL